MNTQRRSRRDVVLAGLSGMAATVIPGGPVRGEQASAAVGASTRPARQDDRSRPARFRLSLAGYSFRQDLDQPGKPGKMSLLDLVDLCADLGIDGVEPTSYYFLRTDDEFVYSLKRRAFLAGLEITGTPIRNNFCLPPGPELDRELAHVRTWVDICVKLGSPVIRIFAGSKPADTPQDTVFTHVVNGMKSACAYAGSKGIFLALENHGYMTETADDVLRILEAVDSPWLGLNLDTGNFQDDPYASIAKTAPHAIVCQVKVMVINPATRQKEPADWARIIDILRQARYRGYLTLEHEEADPHRDVPICIRKLQELTRA